MHQSEIKPEIKAAMQPKLPLRVGTKVDALHPLVDLTRNATRRGDSVKMLKETPSIRPYYVEAPTIDPASAAYYASHDVKEYGGDDLDIQFTEKMTIRCE